ncbi:hypothetical protein BDR26DRAFT_725261 [Obelidium mucronatum]|nr:hypothetical protein BDR26DRAFT_725261 [Obelidium mucronatum]
MFRNKSAIAVIESDSSADSNIAQHGSLPHPSVTSPLSESTPNIPKPSPDMSKSRSASQTKPSNLILKEEALSPPASPSENFGATTPKSKAALTFGPSPTTPKSKASLSFKPKSSKIDEYSEADGLAIIQESNQNLANSKGFLEAPSASPNVKIRRKNSTKSMRNMRLSSSNLEETAVPRFSVTSLFTRKRESASEDEAAGSGASNISLSRRGRSQEREGPGNSRISLFGRPSASRAVSLPAAPRRLSVFRPSAVSTRAINPQVAVGMKFVEEPESEEDSAMEEYRHNSVTDQVLRLFRSLELPSSYLPEYIKRKLPRFPPRHCSIYTSN